MLNGSNIRLIPPGGREQQLADSNEGVITGARPTRADLGFDPAALREKYRLERDKRLRADGNQQYRTQTKGGGKCPG